MQYPEIQFYRSSLVRLASGQLKRVEDLSSDDFIESARLAAANQSKQPKSAPPPATCQKSASLAHQQNPLNPRPQHYQQNASSASNCNTPHRAIKFDFDPMATAQHQARHQQQNGAAMIVNGVGLSGTLDENNNSVFNSPEPTSSCFDGSPNRMKTEDFDEEEEEEIDVELDVVTHDDDDIVAATRIKLEQGDRLASEQGLNLTSRNITFSRNSMQQAEQSYPKSSLTTASIATTNMHFSANNYNHHQSTPCNMDLDDSTLKMDSSQQLLTDNDSQDFYVDSSVVRDFLEVGPMLQQQTAASRLLPASTSPASSTNSLNNQDHNHQLNNNSLNSNNQAYSSLPSTSSSSSSSNSLQSSISPPVNMPQILSTTSATTSQTVLIKFFLETSRSVVFIEVPIEHPFFVFHRGWSSWNPQQTYDKFGLKCRKLKIGDTCISLIRRKSPNQQQDSDQCNILFSSIKINE